MTHGKVGSHDFIATEIDPPGVFEVRCTCGFTGVAFWGAPNAEAVAEEHLRSVGAPLRTLFT